MYIEDIIPFLAILVNKAKTSQNKKKQPKWLRKK
jgi:hypothetical protein